MSFRRVSSLALLLAAACASCTQFDYADESPVLAKPSATVMGLDVPDSPKIREPFTTTLEVRDHDKKRYGYLVRYDAPPSHAANVERTFTTGTVLVENREFERIGFITPLGHAWRFSRTDPDNPEDLGQGNIDSLLPRYFEKPGLSASPIQ